MTITIRHCDDWIAVYKDGVAVQQSHSCSLRDGLRALGIEYEDVNLEGQVDPYTIALPDGSEAFPEEL